MILLELELNIIKSLKLMLKEINQKINKIYQKIDGIIFFFAKNDLIPKKLIYYYLFINIKF